MNFKKYHGSKNLFDYQTMEGTMKGWYLDSEGELVSNGTSGVTDYIPCSGGSFALSKVSGIGLSICLYDENKQFLYGKAYNAPSASGKQTIIVDTSFNASFIRFSFKYQGTSIDDLSTIMLNAGSQPLPYEPYGNTWHDTPHYIMGTDTDTITTLPADIYANDNNATVGLVGNMSQTGAPSPQNPIQPQETGERTGNLFDKNATAGNIYVTASAIRYGVEIPVTAGTYTVSGGTSAFFTKTKINNVYGSALTTETARILELSADGLILLYSDTENNYNNGKGGVMLVKGSTALPYEPYGYKIPILSNSTTTNVYLGEVETTRKIRKIVFTGAENFMIRSGDPSNEFFLETSDINMINNIAVCSHYINSESGAFDDLPDKHSLVRISSQGDKAFFGFRDSDYRYETTFKSFLAAQYAAGTPVCIWYVLATPETAVVNEPIRKIGDYADEVSGITIPTIAGANTLSIGTTLQPSEVSVTYHGWHPVQSVHERESGAWD